MTQTNTDYLFQITSPATDRSFSVSSTDDGATKFDDHLSQASTHAGDDSRYSGSSSQRTESPRYERDDRSWSSAQPKPSSDDNRNSSSSPPSPSNQQDSGDQVDESATAVDIGDRDERETDKSDNTTTAELAGANQAAKDNS